MTSKADIWMPLYIGDYIADTTRLTTEQHGAYLLLIMDYWRNGPIPDDDTVLMQITRMQPDAWSNAASILRAFFKQEAGMLKHDRIEREKANAEASYERKSTRAKAAAGARWAKNATSTAASNAPAMPKQCPSPSPSQIHSIEPNGSIAEPDSPPVDNSPHPGSAKDQAWAIAFPMLIATGIPEPRARSTIAQLLRRCGDEAVLQAAKQAQLQKPVEPISWLQASAKAIATQQSPPGTAKPSRHHGIDRQDFTEGVTRDGRF